MIKKIVETIRKTKGYVFICGNGGSAATAEHFTNDLFSKGIAAICLNSNTAILTMIANDYGYEYIFSKQLELYARKTDLLILFSVSGTSRNIKEALKMDIPKITIFGEKDESYQQAENRHLIMAHEIAQNI